MRTGLREPRAAGAATGPAAAALPAVAAMPAVKAVPAAGVPAAEAVPAVAAGPGAAPFEPPSWEQIVTEHSARVYRLAYRLSGNQHDAEDLTQETFIRVFRSLSSYTPGTFEGWLHRITTNLFLDQVRRRRRIRMVPLGDDAQHVAGPVGLGSPERGFEHTNMDQDVQRALDALSPEFRAAVVLCDIEGLSYEEIAATLGIKLGTVRSRIHRARTQLRQSLAHRAPENAEGPTAGVAGLGTGERP